MASPTTSLHLRLLLAAATVATALALACTGAAHASIDPSTCAHPKGPFTTSGNNILGYVLNHQQAPVRLYGITTYGLSEPNWSRPSATHTIQSDEVEMDAMAADWCANTVRIQAAPANLFNGSMANQAAYIRAIEGEIQHAFADNLVVVLTAQTENTPGGLGLPTSKTVNYWKTLGHALKTYNNVIFDIFNEPRVGPAGSQEMWKLWHDGGTYKRHTYVGMQTLVNSIRTEGIGRQLWVQGPEHGDTLSGATPSAPGQPAEWAITDPLRPAPNFVYDVHHPAGTQHTTTEWATDFGTLAQTQPVVVGEWTNYAADEPECWSNAPTAVPAFLNYVSGLHIGLIAWSLQPGVLTNSTALGSPTSIGPGWACKNGLDQGAGSNLIGFFQQGNAKSSY